MINNKGYGRYELLTVLVLIICISAFLLYQVLGSVNHEKFKTMRASASNFAKLIMADSGSFPNSDNVYLDEAIDSGLVGNSIKSPFGGKCDGAETKFFVDDGKVMVSLRCGDYLIDGVYEGNTKESPIYKVGKWSSKRLSGDNIEEKVLYNCQESGKDVFNDYQEDFYLVYEVNKKYGSNNFYKDDIHECNVVSKKFYRTKEKV